METFPPLPEKVGYHAFVTVRSHQFDFQVSDAYQGRSLAQFRKCLAPYFFSAEYSREQLHCLVNILDHNADVIKPFDHIDSSRSPTLKPSEHAVILQQAN